MGLSLLPHISLLIFSVIVLTYQQGGQVIDITTQPSFAAGLGVTQDNTLTKGEVALLVGNGQVSDEVEIFSPSGKCQHVLPSLPLAVLPNPIVVFVEGRILLCADTVYSYTKSDSTCWSFTPGESKWEEFRTNLTPQPFKRYGKPAVLHDKKLYIIDDYAPEYLDLVSRNWSLWAKPAKSSSVGACLVKVNDAFILMGGIQMGRIVQHYSIEDNSWTTLASPPMDIEYSACLLLPTNKILVLGSVVLAHRRDAALFDPSNNTWTSLGRTAYDRYGTSLVALGDRVFAIGGGRYRDVKVEEFHYENNTWTILNATPLLHRVQHSATALPADLFQYLEGGCEGV